MAASEVNDNFAVVCGVVTTSRGPTEIDISVYRGESQGCPRLDGEVLIRQARVDYADPEWGHRTQITNGLPGPFTTPDRMEVVEPLFGGSLVIEDKFSDTTIPSNEAIALLKEILEAEHIDKPSGGRALWGKYPKAVEESGDGSVLKDIGLYF